MRIETAEQYRYLSDKWWSLQTVLGSQDYSTRTQLGAINTQIMIEMAMEESPFELDEDDHVVCKEGRCARLEADRGSKEVG